MLKKIAVAVLIAAAVPALAFAQKLDMKELQKMGDKASASIKKDADKVQLDQKLDGATKKKKPTAKQVSTPKK